MVAVNIYTSANTCSFQITLYTDSAADAIEGLVDHLHHQSFLESLAGTCIVRKWESTTFDIGKLVGAPGSIKPIAKPKAPARISSGPMAPSWEAMPPTPNPVAMGTKMLHML